MRQVRIVFLTENAELNEEVTGILQKYAYNKVESGPVGQNGLRLIRRKVPDLIILDASKKLTTSLELLQVISEDEVAAIVLILSELNSKLFERARESGVLTFILKPVSEINLVPAVESSLLSYNRLKNLKEEKEKLEKSLEKRKLVEKAKGLIMKKYYLSEDEAYRKLQKHAMDKCISLKELAEAVILADEI